MKKSIAIGILMLFTCLASVAQQLRGRFGSFQIGFTNVILPDLEMNMKTTERMGTDFTLHHNAIKLGGGGFTVKKRLLIGGNSSVALLHKSTGNKGEMSIKSQSGFFNLGYILSVKNRSFSYLYGGIGGGYTRMTIRNNSLSDEIVLGNNHRIQPGQSAKYYAGNPGFETGISWQTFTSSQKENRINQGFLLGINAGLIVIPFKETWKYTGNDKSVPGLTYQSTVQWHVTVCIAGGGIRK